MPAFGAFDDFDALSEAIACLTQNLSSSRFAGWLFGKHLATTSPFGWSPWFHFSGLQTSLLPLLR
jgi:hypothetical protein